jgi:hypothetical protein
MQSIIFLIESYTKKLCKAFNINYVTHNKIKYNILETHRKFISHIHFKKYQKHIKLFFKKIKLRKIIESKDV